MRDKIYTPESLFEAFLEYKHEVKNNPRLVEKQGYNKPITISIERPLTISGFEAFTEHNLSRYLSAKDSYSEFCNIAYKIKKAIESDLIEGGLLMQYNQQLTARLTGLNDIQVGVENQVSEIKIITVSATEEIETLKQLQR